MTGLVGGLLAAVLVLTGLGGAASATPEQAGAAGSNATMQVAGVSLWAPSWDYNPFATSGYPAFAPNLLYQSLAIQIPPRLTDLVPQLATHWSEAGSTVKVFLRGAAKWQDGTPVTSKDVVTTAYLDGVDGSPFWNDIAGVSAHGAHEVIFQVQKGVTAKTAALNVLTELVPYPASVYGRFLTPKLRQQTLSYWRAVNSGSATATTTPGAKAIGVALNKLNDFKPATIVGDGPFRLLSINTSQAELTRSATFYGASKVHIKTLKLITDADNEGGYGQAYSGEFAISDVVMTAPVVQKWLTFSNAHLAEGEGFEGVLVFNSNRYPLSMVKVRQALAYLSPRAQMNFAAYGKSSGKYSYGTPEKIADGLTPAVAAVYLTKAQLKSLNPYGYNPDKAAALLRQSGFKKVGGAWMTPKGSPFSLNIITSSSQSDVAESELRAAGSYKQFGIKATVTSEESTAFAAAVHAGSFSIAGETIYSSNPLAEFDSLLGSEMDYSTSGAFKGQKGLGFGPTVKVPGLGKVNVPTTLDAESRTVGPGPEMSALTWDWSRLVNEQVPFYGYKQGHRQIPYSTKQFTDWPPQRGGIWRVMGVNMTGGMALMFEDGYLHAR